ncbi:MAG: DNA polymerase III subunit delta [Desulfonatronovibrio sp.]
MSRPGFYFCFCPDSNLLKMQIGRVLESAGQGEWSWQTIWLDEQDQEDRLWNALNQPVMAGPSRAVILRRCESPGNSFWTDISPTLSGFRPGIWPFFCFESEWKYGKPKISAHLSKKKYFKFARSKGWIWEFPGLTRQNISRYISRKCQKLGLKTGPGVVEHLSAILPLDSHGVDMELEKITLLACPETTITKEHLKPVSSRPDIDIFSFLQGVQSGKDKSAAWKKIFQEKLKGQEMLFPFLGLLIREARILWRLSTSGESGVQLNPRIRQQKKAMASKLGQAGISLLWNAALEAEAGVKSGQVTPGQAMDRLTLKLFKLFSG